ncbi:MAG: TIGR03545 family protein [Colwellia sp.]
MARFIRWQGIVAFFVLSTLVAVFIYLFAESLVKSVIISSAESAFGAEVNVVDVQLAYTPLEISVIGMQVTDKESPSHNVFSFERATAGIDVWQYLFGKIIIEKLGVSELAFASERAAVGEVYLDEESSDEEKESLSAQAKAMLPEMGIELPDVKTLLNDSNLFTIKASETLQASYKTEQAKLIALKTQLPTKEKLQYYQDKVKALGDINVKSLDDIEKIKTQYDKIKAEFEVDQALIKKAKQQVVASKELLAKQVNDLKEAPSKDWQHIEKTYQLDSIEGEDFAHMIFGEQAREYYQQAQWAYEQVAPLMASNGDEPSEVAQKNHEKGRFVYFDEEKKMPSVLIKQALFSMKLEQGDFTIKGTELTHQHWIRGIESVVNVSSISNGEFNISSHFKLTKLGDFIAEGDWFIKGRSLSNSTLTETDALTLAIDKAQLSGEGTFSLVKGDILSANHFSLNNASYQGHASTKLTNLLLDTMKSLDKLTLDVGVNGSLNKPSFSIASSLTNALTGAFKKQVSEKADEFKLKVNQGLNEKLASALKLGDNQTAELLDLEALLTDTDNAFENLKNSDVVDQQKQKLKNEAKDKIEDKLKEKLGNLFG